MCSVTELKDEFQKYLNDSRDYYSDKEPITDRKLLQLWLDCAEPREKRIQELEKENNLLKEQMKKLRQYMINTFEEMVTKEENMIEVDNLRDEVRNLDKSVKSCWRHQLILAGVLCFTEICDLIVNLFQK